MTPQRTPPIDIVPTVPQLIRHAVERHGSRDCIVEPGDRVTFSEIDRLSRAFAKRLIVAGVGKGTRVAAKYPNGIDWVIAWLAVTRIGGFFQPLSSAYKNSETQTCLRIGDASLFLTPPTIVGRDQRPAVEEVIGTALPDASGTITSPDLPYLRRVVFAGRFATGPDAMDMTMPDPDAERIVPDALLDAIEAQVVPADWMLAIFTSGSTSHPKCVVHTHGAVIRHATAIIDVNRWSAQDKIFAGMPFFWVGGNCYSVVPAMLCGAALLCIERFEAEPALDLMEREGATHVLGWPGVLNPLLDHPSLPARNIAGFERSPWSPRISFNTGLGMSETGSNHTVRRIEERDLPEAIGSVGRSIPFIEHRIVDSETGTSVPEGDTGNIQVRGYSVMNGLYKREREETFEPDGFFDTKDRGFLRDGYLFFAGRDIGLIKTAGNNVSAAEVEVALRALPGVAAAHVVGLPDERIGQTVAAAVMSDGSTLDPADLRAALALVLSAFKVPKIVRIVTATEIPILPNGKLDHRALIRLIGGEETKA